MIDGVAAKGIYVRLLDPPVTVMVAREDLPRGRVEFDVAHQRLALRGGASMTLGDSLSVTLESINLSARVAHATTKDIR